MNLGEIHEALKNMDPSARVYINFGEPTSPGDIGSWRGDYSEAALTYSRAHIDDGDATVQNLIDKIEAAYSATHYGYKGGEFIFTPETRVWIAEYGWSGECGVGEIIDQGWCVLIQPCHQSY